jgi:hypothetical protein
MMMTIRRRARMMTTLVGLEVVLSERQEGLEE